MEIDDIKIIKSTPKRCPVSAGRIDADGCNRAAANAQNLPVVQYPSAGTRQVLPNRRLSETRRLTWRPPGNVDAAETIIVITIGYDPCVEDAPGPVEIFYNSGYRTGSDLEVLVTDICVILSLFLQYDGIEIGSFGKAISQTVDQSQHSESGAADTLVPGSLVGLLLRELQRPPEWA